ncbi:DJ-1/PfpI family protein [Candidatus Woesearchaeota archaeon]|nr:DJ-1/PfpI family protein [Candidatus Woesearchaeota archaeon]
MPVLFIIAQDSYQDWEYETPKQILEEADIKVITASKKIGLARGSLGGHAQVAVSLDKVNVAEYQAIVFIGGPGARKYQQDPSALRIAQQANVQKKLIGAICIAPTILAHAGILKGKNATVWDEDQEQHLLIEKLGANYINKPVVIDNNIITADGPQVAKEFGEVLVHYLQKKK